MEKIDDSTQKLIPTALIILDGFGWGVPNDPGNAITETTAPNIFGYLKKYPHSTLKTYGENVGLFPGQTGNSEAGHLNIGAGRIVKQDLVIISDAVRSGSFFVNHAFKHALHHAEKNKSDIHIIGLLTDGNSAHACPEHLYALLDFFRREKFDRVYLHLFTDGRDAPPHSAVEFLNNLRLHMTGKEKIATIAGRHYAMDRNKNWERTEAMYNAMVLGQGYKAISAEKAIVQAYDRSENDEHVSVTVIEDDTQPVATIKDNDAIVFFNARSDRARQITKAFVQDDFEAENPGAFKRQIKLKNIVFVAMTDFGPDLSGIQTAFVSPDIKNCVPKVIDGKYKQLYISETEKFAHVTYFFNGGFAKPLNGEKREAVHSAGEYSFATRPEMNTDLMVDKIVQYLQDGTYNFICANIPNADMVGHTGNIEATKKAVKVLDNGVGRIVQTMLKLNGQVLIVADHGNAELMLNKETKEMITEHSKNPVPCILIKENFSHVMHDGILADVAPTLLKLMDIKQPEEMTGKCLF